MAINKLNSIFALSLLLENRFSSHKAESSSFDADRLGNPQICLQIAFPLRMPLPYLIFSAVSIRVACFQRFLLRIDTSFGRAVASSRNPSGGIVIAVKLFQVNVAERLAG